MGAVVDFLDARAGAYADRLLKDKRLIVLAQNIREWFEPEDLDEIREGVAESKADVCSEESDRRLDEEYRDLVGVEAQRATNAYGWAVLRGATDDDVQRFHGAALASALEYLRAIEAMTGVSVID